MGAASFASLSMKQEVTVDLTPAFEEPELEEIFPKPYKRGKKRIGKRQEEIKNVPVTVVTHRLSEEELCAAFPDGRFKKLPMKYINVWNSTRQASK